MLLRWLIGRQSLAHEGTMTVGTFSQGTTTVTVTRGWRTTPAVGSNTTIRGVTYSGLFRRSASGAVPLAVFTFFESPQISGAANVQVSRDSGASWVSLLHGTDPVHGITAYHVAGDPLNIAGIPVDTVVPVWVQYA